MRSSAKRSLRDLCLPALAGKAKYFSIRTVRVWFKVQGIVCAATTVKQYMSELTTKGFVQDAGRGWYTFVKEPFDLDPQPTAELVDLLEGRYPLLDFACWSTAQIKDFTHHTLAKFVSFVWVERHNMSSVFETLRDAGFDVYLDPSRGEADKSFAVREKTVVVRPSIAGQPVKGKLATIEKILVDLYVECRALPLMDIAEYRRTFTNLVSACRISVSALAMYAERRKIPVSDLFAEGEHTISTL